MIIKNKKIKVSIFLFVLILLTSKISLAESPLHKIANDIKNNTSKEFIIMENEDVSHDFAKNSLKKITTLLDGIIDETPSTKMTIKTRGNQKSLIFSTRKPKYLLKDTAEYKNFMNNIKKETKEMGKIEKVKYVNNIISKKVEYGNNNIETYSSSAGDNPVYTAYGALINGKSVCQGYANLFSLIMNDLNIPTIKIRGYSRESNIYHVWNSVLIDNEWLYVDVTWNDDSGDKHLLTTEKFEKDYRIWDKSMEDNIRKLKMIIDY